MGRRSQAVQRERREAGMGERLREMAEIAAENLPRREGDAVGCLQWTDFRTGRVRRWVVRIGDRADRLTMETPGGTAGPSHGWAWILDRLRSHLCGH